MPHGDSMRLFSMYFSGDPHCRGGGAEGAMHRDASARLFVVHADDRFTLAPFARGGTGDMNTCSLPRRTHPRRGLA